MGGRTSQRLPSDWCGVRGRAVAADTAALWRAPDGTQSSLTSVQDHHSHSHLILGMDQTLLQRGQLLNLQAAGESTRPASVRSTHQGLQSGGFILRNRCHPRLDSPDVAHNLLLLRHLLGQIFEPAGGDGDVPRVTLHAGCLAFFRCQLPVNKAWGWRW